MDIVKKEELLNTAVENIVSDTITEKDVVDFLNTIESFNNLNKYFSHCDSEDNMSNIEEIIFWDTDKLLALDIGLGYDSGMETLDASYFANIISRISSNSYILLDNIESYAELVMYFSDYIQELLDKYNLSAYFDYEAYGQDLASELEGYLSEYGWFEWT